MAQTALFTVTLADATTKVAFKEHTKGSDTCVEAEPDAECFVHIEVPKGTHVAVERRVDGKSLSSAIHFGPRCVHVCDAGLSSSDGIDHAIQSLKFAKASFHIQRPWMRHLGTTESTMANNADPTFKTSSTRSVAFAGAALHENSSRS
jgi:hypothetical protein